MSSELANRFVNRLQYAEQTGDIEMLMELFSEDAEISNLVIIEPFKGQAGVRRFWLEYLKEFQQITSHFVSVIENDTTIVLEWTSEGLLKSGEPISYRGVTILKTESGKIINLRSYYDSAAFLSEGARHAALKKT